MKKKKIKWKLVIAFIVFELIFTVVTAPFILLYGPFDNAKRIYVGSAMTTFRHQYLATAFLSKERIDQILNSAPKGETATGDNGSTVDITGTHSNAIDLYKFENSKYTGYMMVIKNPKRIKIAYTNSLYKKGETTSQMAMDNNAVAAVNGGAFVDTSSSANWTGNGGTPSGVIISDGKEVFSDLKPGQKTPCMAMDAEGKMYAGSYTLQQLKNMGITQAVSFGPVLIKNGQPLDLSSVSASWGVAPRTAIGQRADGSIVMMVIDGRSIVDGLGATITELQSLMLTKGKCVTAINLDGGKSSTMYLDGKVINNLSNGLGERYIASAVVVK
ncbi:phosphodiester glycosidase family protein [uncultured Clostridium sp.]|uniref:phosphodiester glycosidase family protein n=1 Tax=uncultured Clostridium sp. TaxID=59620 RepID=UPI0026271051|nr:phosphodiester glycosidase family protein [uncultured Clostridium sp.]